MDDQLPLATASSPSWWGRRAAIGLVLALVAGTVFRLAWGRDIEYKADEAAFFEEARQVQSLRDLSFCGQTASVGVPAPGMSVWVLIGLAKAFAANDPPALARAVQICNVAALLLLIVFIYRCVPPGEREAWLWAAALAAVNPITVLLHRKIWNPSVLPLFTVLILWAWWRRERRAGAFFWGLLGPLMGQIHAGGFFFAAGFALWALAFDRRRVAWGSWLIGSCLGSLTMLPWLWQLAGQPGHGPYHADSWVHLFEFKFWTRWSIQALGLGIEYNLGAYQYQELLRFPYVFGRPTYFVAVLHGIVAAVGMILMAKAASLLWRRRGHWTWLWNGTASPSAFTLGAVVLGFGLLQTLSCFPTHRHYLVILFPLQFLAVTRLALHRSSPDAAPRPRARVMLGVLWSAQLLITFTLLSFIHFTGRMGGEYGTAYSAQTDPVVVAYFSKP